MRQLAGVPKRGGGEGKIPSFAHDKERLGAPYTAEMVPLATRTATSVGHAAPAGPPGRARAAWWHPNQPHRPLCSSLAHKPCNHMDVATVNTEDLAQVKTSDGILRRKTKNYRC